VEEAIWSSLIARRVAQKLGYGLPDTPADAGAILFDADAEQVAKELCEAFRYLRPEQIRTATDFADFLRTNRLDGAGVHRPTWVPQMFREVRDLALFLKERYGEDQPADEKDYWTDEDRRDAQLASWRRLEEEDPYPWEDPEDAQTG
jgi:hypothetical protein